MQWQTRWQAMASRSTLRAKSDAPPSLQVIISTNIENQPNQQVDMEVIDGSNHRNVYQAKKDIKGETRMAITTHADADLGVCFTNLLPDREFSW